MDSRPLIANENIIRPQGSGRGYFLRNLFQRGVENSAISPSSMLPIENMKINVENTVVHNQSCIDKSCFQDDDADDHETPATSTYSPPVLNNHDESIFDVENNCNIKFEECNGIEVKVNGKNIPDTIKSFETIKNIPINLMINIKNNNFVNPTPIQQYSIPIILCGKDLMATAQTGSGKTIAFILPVIQKLIMEPVPLVKNKKHCEPQVIIIVPTRELAIQIKMIITKLTRNTGIRSFACYGGVKATIQREQILKGHHILVATVGRLHQFVRFGVVTFSSVRIFVWNEVDRMFHRDIKPAIDSILNHFSMPPVINRQTIMMSATLPDETQHLAKLYLKNDYLFLAVGIVSSISNNIKQVFYTVHKFKKREIVANILKKDSAGTIIFVKQKWAADFLASYLNKKKIPSISIHGDYLQDHRTRALHNFRLKKINVLVATNIVSRGLDIKCVNHVINFDMPETIEDYVQRIGRIGRLKHKSFATSFFDYDEDIHLVAPLIKTLALANQEIPDWLANLGRTIKYNNANHFMNQFGGSDIRVKPI